MNNDEISTNKLRFRLLHLKKLSQDKFKNRIFYDFARYIALHLNGNKITKDKFQDYFAYGFSDIKNNIVGFTRSPLHNQKLPTVFENLCESINKGSLKASLSKEFKTIIDTIWELNNKEEDSEYNFERVLKLIEKLSQNDNYI